MLIIEGHIISTLSVTSFSYILSDNDYFLIPSIIFVKNQMFEDPFPRCMTLQLN